MSFSKIISFSSLLLASTVHSHSWLHCSDYTENILGQDYDEEHCDGYIRQYATKWGGVDFAVDTGIQFQASTGDYCQGNSYNGSVDSWYSDEYPYAKWDYNREITLVWPAKNHANYFCFSNIPDTSMKLYKNPTVNPTSELTDCCDDWDLLIDWHDGCTPGTDGCGFQNCPDFCAETDDAPCFGTYTVKDTDFPTPGVYTLMWYWIFNVGTAPYTTCFEVEITGDYYNITDGNTYQWDTYNNTDIDGYEPEFETTQANDNNNDNDSGDTTHGYNNTGGNTYNNTDDDRDEPETTQDNDNNNDNDDEPETTQYYDNNNDNMTTQTATQMVTQMITTDGNTDGNTDSNTGGNTNDNNDGSGDSTSYDYLVQIPICYKGGTYDEATLTDGADAEFANVDIEIGSFEVLNDLETDDEWFNVTIQVETNSPGIIISAAYDYADGSSDLCNTIEDEYNVGSCIICDPDVIRFFQITSTDDFNTTSSASGGSGSGDSDVVVQESSPANSMFVNGLCQIIMVSVAAHAVGGVLLW